MVLKPKPTIYLNQCIFCGIKKEGEGKWNMCNECIAVLKNIILKERK